MKVHLSHLRVDERGPLLWEATVDISYLWMPYVRYGWTSAMVYVVFHVGVRRGRIYPDYESVMRIRECHKA